MINSQKLEQIFGQCPYIIDGVRHVELSKDVPHTSQMGVVWSRYVMT